MNVTSLEVYYCDKDHYTLYARNFGVIDRYSGQDEIKYYFYYGDTEYELGYSGNTQYDRNGIPQRDPAVVIDQRIRINHVFYIFDAFRSFEKHQTVTAQTGTEYDGELLCKLLAYVIDNPKKKYNLYDIENTIKHYQPKQRNHGNHLTLSSQQNISVGQAKPQTSVGQATERTTDKLLHDLRSALATDTGQKVLGFVQSLAQKAERDTGSGLIKSLTGFLNSVSDAVAPANQGDFVTPKPQKVPSPKEKDAKAHHDHDVRNESDKTETPQEQERIKHVAGQQQPVDSDKPNPSDTIWKIHIFKNQEPNHFDSNSNARIPLKAPVSTSEILVKGRYSIPHEKYSIDDHEYFQVSISENGNLCGGSVNSLNELISIISRADDCYCNKARNWTYDTFSPGSAVDLLKKASDKIYYQNDWVKLERRNGMILFWMNSHPFILSSHSVDDGSVLYIQNESRVIFKIRDFCDIRKTLYLADIGQPVFYHVMGFNVKDYEPFRETDCSYIGPVMASKVPLSLSLICFYIALRFKLGNVWNWKDTDEDTSDEMNPSFQDILIAHDYVQGKMKPAALCKPHEPQDRRGNPLDLYDHSAKPFGFGWIWHKERWVYVRDKCNPPEKQDWCWMRNGWQFAWKYVGNWSNNDLRPREGFNYSNGNYDYVNDEYNPPSEYSTWVKGDMYSNAHWK